MSDLNVVAWGAGEPVVSGRGDLGGAVFPWPGATACGDPVLHGPALPWEAELPLKLLTGAHAQRVHHRGKVEVVVTSATVLELVGS